MACLQRHNAAEEIFEPQILDHGQAALVADGRCQFTGADRQRQHQGWLFQVATHMAIAV